MSSEDRHQVQGSPNAQTPQAIVQYPEPYVQPLILKALRHLCQPGIEIIEHGSKLLDSTKPIVQFRAYEELDFNHAMQHASTSLVCAYVIRKALIRKHFLANTIATWLVKHPKSLLKDHFKPSIHFELDYAEFLDEALVDAWDLHESMTRNATTQDSEHKEWWILKPGMSDGGNGIRLFSSIEDLQQIFEAWDPPEEIDDENDAESEQVATMTENLLELNHDQALMTTQLRHFIVQPYIDPPLLLPAYENRKFHIRCYVLAVGALKVFVYKEMLALFAAMTYEAPRTTGDMGSPDLAKHLTNTCFQEEATKSSSVQQFWQLDEKNLSESSKEIIFSEICEITGEVFEAAAREQMVHFQVIPNAFEVFGLDFLLDANQKAWLLEVNAYPDFKQTGESLQEDVIGGLFEETVRTAVQPFFGQHGDADGTKRMVLVRNIDVGRQ